jgi:lipopolysaccharide/colanic/teichoic acid biosynthesis glycosyltransferase
VATIPGDDDAPTLRVASMMHTTPADTSNVYPLVAQVAGSATYEKVKRAFDVAVSAAALTMVSVPMLAIMVAIRLEDGDPAMFRQTRVGKNRREFTCFKLRTMSTSHDTNRHKEYLEHLIANGESEVATHLSNREITKIGAFLRKTSLDELPQLINVLLGDMSIVGPRPPIPYEVDVYEPWHLQRLLVTPGLTGWWQVTGRGRVTFDDMVRMDIDYIRSRGYLKDLEIVFKTPLALVKGSG